MLTLRTLKIISQLFHSRPASSLKILTGFYINLYDMLF